MAVAHMTSCSMSLPGLHENALWFSWDLLQMRSWRGAGRWWPQWTPGNKHYCSVLVRNHETARALLSSCWASFHTGPQKVVGLRGLGTEGTSVTQGCPSLLWDILYILHKIQHSVYEIKLLKPSCLAMLLIWDQAFLPCVFYLMHSVITK